MNIDDTNTKWDKVHDFMSAGENGTKLTKIELALYYLAHFYSPEYREIRVAGFPLENLAGDIEINEPIYSESISFTRQDVLDYLVSVGHNLSPYAEP